MNDESSKKQQFKYLVQLISDWVRPSGDKKLDKAMIDLKNEPGFPHNKVLEKLMMRGVYLVDAKHPIGGWKKLKVIITKGTSVQNLADQIKFKTGSLLGPMTIIKKAEATGALLYHSRHLTLTITYQTIYVGSVNQKSHKLVRTYDLKYDTDQKKPPFTGGVVDIETMPTVGWKKPSEDVMKDLMSNYADDPISRDGKLKLVPSPID